MVTSVVPFDMLKSGDPRRDFRDWVRNNFRYFGGFNGSKAARNEDERQKVIDHKETIMDAARQVLEWTNERYGQGIVKYYADDLPRLQVAYDAGDWNEFLEALNSLFFGIDWE